VQAREAAERAATLTEVGKLVEVPVQPVHGQ
jgi:hypothetical protein